MSTWSAQCGRIAIFWWKTGHPALIQAELKPIRMSKANENFSISSSNIIAWIQSKFNSRNKYHKRDWDTQYAWFVVLFFSENWSSHFHWTYRSSMLSDTNNFCKILIILMLMNDWIVKSRSACKMSTILQVRMIGSIGSGAPGTQQKVLRN